jgi:hypothetical protein
MHAIINCMLLLDLYLVTTAVLHAASSLIGIKQKIETSGWRLENVIMMTCTSSLDIKHICSAGEWFSSELKLEARH